MLATEDSRGLYIDNNNLVQIPNNLSLPPELPQMTQLVFPQRVRSAAMSDTATTPVKGK